VLHDSPVRAWAARPGAATGTGEAGIRPGEAAPQLPALAADGAGGWTRAGASVRWQAAYFEQLEP